jgi:pimeloyl-ACP methyl ester carboxylesterase
VALELAAVRPVASMALLSPAGLWRDHTPVYDRVTLRLSRWLARHAEGLLCRMVRYRAARILILGQTHGRPTRMTAEQARTTIRALGRCPGFDATLRATIHRHYRAGAVVDAPITVAFGSRDLVLLRRQSRHVEQLPPHAQSQELPGCGHVPMFDDPSAVTSLIVANRRSTLVRA